MQAFPIGFSWEWPVWTVEQWWRECSHVAWFLVLLKSWKTCLLALSLESWWLLPKCAEQNFPQEVSTDLRTQQNKQIKQQKNHHHNNTTNHWDTKKCFTQLNNEFRTSGKGEMPFTARNFACANNNRYGGQDFHKSNFIHSFMIPSQVNHYLLQWSVNLGYCLKR